ncbi:MAG: (Fe-S)-binding protein [Promethearchaeota archaeon]|nr:MAG: (Fe-S)-binding protein [Candidatus Lokiarchaeota archaeon]
MVDFKNLRQHNDLIQICARCGDCATTGTQISTAKRHVSEPCPVKNVLGFEAYDARGRIIIMKRLLENNMEFDEDFLEWAYTCTECGSCRETCLAIEDGIDTPLLVDALRQDLVENNIKLEKHKQILNSINKDQNPYNEPKSERFGFLDHPEDYFQTENAEYILYIGCTECYRQQNVAISTIELLNHLGVKFLILEDEPCCGSILKRYGYEQDFKRIAKSNLKQMEEKNIKKVIFPCAGCYRTYKIDYKDYNTTNLEFYHLTEFLEEFLTQHAFGFKSQSHKKIAYHDPCHLGRHSGVYEAPRELLRLIENSTYIELDSLRNYSHCCGAGGGVKSSNPELAVKMAERRNNEAIEKNADIFVTACPFCERNLNDGLPETPNGFKVIDIAEILNETIQKELSSEVQNKLGINAEICRNYMDFLSQYPEIFSDLIKGCDMNFAVYDSFDDFEEEKPMDVFHVLRNGEGIEILAGKADDADLELALSKEAVQKLINTKKKEDYANLFGSFYNEPSFTDGWIDFLLHKRTRTLIDMGYGRFAETAGILDDEEDAL